MHAYGCEEVLVESMAALILASALATGADGCGLSESTSAVVLIAYWKTGTLASKELQCVLSRATQRSS